MKIPKKIHTLYFGFNISLNVIVNRKRMLNEFSGIFADLTKPAVCVSLTLMAFGLSVFGEGNKFPIKSVGERLMGK